MPKWYFLVVLDSDEYQILGITIIIHVYYVLIIGSVFYALCLVSAYSCIGHASHMHTRCTFAAHTLTLDMFYISLMLVKSCQTFQHLTYSCVYVMPRFTSCSIILSMSCSLCFVAIFFFLFYVFVLCLSFIFSFILHPSCIIPLLIYFFLSLLRLDYFVYS